MAELNEEQLLLLNNLMYYDGSTKQQNSVGDIAQEILNGNISAEDLQGGMTMQQMKDIANAINNDTYLSSLKVVASEDSAGFRASCFQDTNTMEVTVAVRGTGGSYEAWSDNVKGAYDTDTKIQEKMENFINTDCANYNNITVTGHSKGGNLAQYVTVHCGDKIDRCVSYDGQGFNDEFLDKYAPEIAANQDKIKSICSDSDYVNPLLNSIADETIYLPTNSPDFANEHSSFTLWEANQGAYDENGEYTNSIEQSDTIKAIDKISDSLVDYINDMPDYLEKPFVNTLASVVGLIFAHKSDQAKFSDWLDAFKNLFLLNISYQIYKLDVIGKTIQAISNLKTFVEHVAEYFASKMVANFTVNVSTLKREQSNIEASYKRLQQLEEEMSDIRKSMNLSFAILKPALLKEEADLKKRAKDLKELHDALEDITSLYEKTENKLSSSFSY